MVVILTVKAPITLTVIARIQRPTALLTGKAKRMIVLSPNVYWSLCCVVQEKIPCYSLAQMSGLPTSKRRIRESHTGSGQNTNRVDGRAADVTFVIENVIVVLLTVRQAILFPVLIRS